MFTHREFDTAWNAVEDAEFVNPQDRTAALDAMKALHELAFSCRMDNCDEGDCPFNKPGGV